ncbi:tetratricopeptide repeat protein 31 isoform X2 [Elgaria multicarinata webbii]|uniref:tetratricopeptide repeat protein 31 isoform X2 n=1 Tax=Elgaria multicarinata webbii TaxID=159646 RepID=UPI002FCD3E6F
MIMERLVPAVDEEEEEEEEEGGEEEEAALYARHEACVAMGRKCPDIDGEPCWHCEDDFYGYEAWVRYSGELEEEVEQQAHAVSPATFCGFKKSFLCKPSAPAPPASNRQDCPLLGIALPQKQRLTAEEAEKNAEELVAEEERLKKKAEKKRMKKKRQKDRKRQEKRDQELKAKVEADKPSYSRDRDPLVVGPSALGPGPTNSEGSSVEASPGRSPNRSTEEEEEEEETEEELDLSSTFVSKACLKAGTKPLLAKKEKPARPDGKEAEAEAKPEVPRPGVQMTPVEQSMVLADCGNETAKQGRYQEAVLLFTEAIKLNPREYRFFGNRSFCYERLQCFTEALCDAQLALSLQPGWPKGLFRQGKALMGLKQENSFSGCPPEWNVLAREAQLPPSGGRPLASSRASAGGHLASVTITNSQGKVLVPPAPRALGREWFAVWVGNLTPKVTEEVLLRYFQPFGPIDSIRQLPRKSCAFVNYSRREAAEAAYAALQGVEVDGSKLLLQLKHPVHATPPPTKAPTSAQQPAKWEPIHAPSAAAAYMAGPWLRSLGQLP